MGKIKKVAKKKKTKKKSKKVATLKYPLMEINFVMQENFVSKPLWKITSPSGLIYWPKDTEDKWNKKNYVMGAKGAPPPKLKFKEEFVELASKKRLSGAYFILVQNGSDEVWINVGKLKTEQKKEYRLAFEHAKQKRKAQYGIRGTAQVRCGGNTLDLKMIGVRWQVIPKGVKDPTGKKKDKPPYTGNTRHFGPITPLRPGLYRGFVHRMEKSFNKHGEDALFKNPTIHVTNHWGWDDKDKKWKWKKGVKKGVKKDKVKGSEIFIHRAGFPDQLEGCLALGRNETDYGFESFAHSLQTMREVFALLVIKTKAQHRKAQNLTWGKKPRVIITMTDERPGSTDTASLSIRLKIDPGDSKTADDKFTLRSTDGSYNKVLTVKDDSKPGDKFVDLIYEDIDRSLSYTLEVDPGSEGDKYLVFDSQPYSEILRARKGS